MKNIHFIISLIHIFFTGPLLIYIGIAKPSHILFYILLFILAIIIILSFIYRYFTKKLYAWLYVHLLLFSVLLLFIAYLKFTKKNIPYYLYSFLIAIGAGAIGYHIIKLLRN